MKFRFLVVVLLVTFVSLFAQHRQGPKLPVNVSNITLTDLDKEPADFSEWGKKHLMIFYVDPDAHKQNRDFQAELETNPRARSTNFQAYAVLNLKDTALPNGIVRSIADKRTKGKPSINLADNNRILSTAWNLGDVNNKFCLLFVTKDGELVYFRAGEFTDQDKKDFFDICDKYR
jgi:predicted transcriptional regulator